MAQADERQPPERHQDEHADDAAGVDEAGPRGGGGGTGRTRAARGAPRPSRRAARATRRGPRPARAPAGHPGWPARRRRPHRADDAAEDHGVHRLGEPPRGSGHGGGAGVRARRRHRGVLPSRVLGRGRRPLSPTLRAGPRPPSSSTSWTCGPPSGRPGVGVAARLGSAHAVAAHPAPPRRHRGPRGRARRDPPRDRRRRLRRRRRAPGTPATTTARSTRSTRPDRTGAPTRARSSGPGCPTRRTTRRARTGPVLLVGPRRAVAARAPADEPGPRPRRGAGAPGRPALGRHRLRRLGLAGPAQRGARQPGHPGRPRAVRREGAVLSPDRFAEVAAAVRRARALTHEGPSPRR